MLRDLVLQNRSVRRFDEGSPVPMDTLRGLVDLARLGPSGANRQPLRYYLANTPELNERIFPNLAWAGYLTDWNGPEEGERPPAYILILGDREVSGGFGCDHGIAAQTIALGATEQGLRVCMIGSIRRTALMEALALPEERYELLLVIALGAPKEKVRLEAVGEDGNIEYWRDETGIHHVPKRALDAVIVGP